MGMKAVPYDILGAPVTYVDPIYADEDTFLSYCSFYEACQRLIGIKALNKLQLLLPCRFPVDGCYHLGRAIFLSPEACTQTNPWHLQAKHSDRFFRTHLENIRSTFPRLDVTIVLLHIKRDRRPWSSLESDKEVLGQAQSDRYKVDYGIEDLDPLAPPYNVVDCKDIQEARYPFEIPPQPRRRFFD